MFSLRRVLPVLMLVIVQTIAIATAAYAGGTWMKTPDQEVAPGEEVDLVGYVGAADAPRVEESQWLARLNLAPMPEHGSVEPRWMPLGPVTVERSGLGGYLEYRVSLTFTVPDVLEPGNYMIAVSNEAGDYLGDLIGASLAIGVEPWPPSYEWPRDEPLVAQLPDHAWLRGPNWEITAGQVKRKIYPICQWSCFLDPSNMDDPRVVMIDATPTWATMTSPTTTTSTAANVESTTATTTAVPALKIPLASPRGMAAPVPIEGRWWELWWIFVTLGGVAYLASRPSQPQVADDVRVLEDDLSEPTKV